MKFTTSTCAAWLVALSGVMAASVSESYLAVCSVNEYKCSSGFVLASDKKCCLTAEKCGDMPVCKRSHCCVRESSISKEKSETTSDKYEPEKNEYKKMYTCADKFKDCNDGYTMDELLDCGEDCDLEMCCTKDQVENEHSSEKHHKQKYDKQITCQDKYDVCEYGFELDSDKPCDHNCHRNSCCKPSESYEADKKQVETKYNNQKYDKEMTCKDKYNVCEYGFKLESDKLCGEDCYRSSCCTPIEDTKYEDTSDEKYDDEEEYDESPNKKYEDEEEYNETDSEKYEDEEKYDNTPEEKYEDEEEYDDTPEKKYEAEEKYDNKKYEDEEDYDNTPEEKYEDEKKYDNTPEEKYEDEEEYDDVTEEKYGDKKVYDDDTEEKYEDEDKYDDDTEEKYDDVTEEKYENEDKYDDDTEEKYGDEKEYDETSNKKYDGNADTCVDHISFCPDGHELQTDKVCGDECVKHVCCIKKDAKDIKYY